MNDFNILLISSNEILPTYLHFRYANFFYTISSVSGIWTLPTAIRMLHVQQHQTPKIKSSPYIVWCCKSAYTQLNMVTTAFHLHSTNSFQNLFHMKNGIIDQVKTHSLWSIRHRERERERDAVSRSNSFSRRWIYLVYSKPYLGAHSTFVHAKLSYKILRPNKKG